MASKAMDLFEAYEQDKLPKDQGYIVSSFFSLNTTYSKYEIVSYAGVKSIYLTEEGLTFQTNGKKLHILVEPPNYPNKATEPFLRTSADVVPVRFIELNQVVSKNQTRIMIAKKPFETFSSFTVLKPSGINFALVFYHLSDVYDTMTIFLEKTFNKEAGVAMVDARKAAGMAIEIVKDSMGWPAEAINTE